MNLTIWRGIACAALFGLATPAVADDARHLGVESCAGNNCHGAVQRIGGSHVPQNEYFIWSQKDKHAKAYAVLLTDRSKKIAKNLNLSDPPEKAALCLDCHADNAKNRGPQFNIADGVGCEACHGGASTWLGTHLSGYDHKANLAAGLYPTDQPLARAVKCQSCHLGDDNKFLAHKIMGAGHPPTPFELDTFTAIQPAHFVVDKSYIERKGPVNDMQIWAVGQAEDVKQRMDLLLKHPAKGINVELSLFDCQACHHSLNELQWRPRASTGLEPGRVKLYDATAVMLRVAAERVAPDTAKALREHMLALHAATNQSWQAVEQAATAVKQDADALIPKLAEHNFDKADAQALAAGVMAEAIGGGDLDYSGAQQQVMAIESVVAAMKLLGFADDNQLAGLKPAIDGLLAAVADDQKYSPDAYAAAMKALKAKLAM